MTTKSSMGARPRRNADQQNATSNWARKYMISLGRPGVRAKAKRQARRQERQEGKRLTEDA